MRKPCAFILILAMCCTMLPGAFADNEAKLPEAEGVVRIFVDGILRERGVSSGETIYVSLDTLNRVYSVNLAYEYDRGKNIIRISDEGFTFSQTLDRVYADMNGGFIFNNELYIISGEKLYVPWKTAVEMLCVRGEEKDGSLYLRSDKAVYFAYNSDYYNEKYGKDNVYWLSRLIYAEAMNQPMEALISVGNVVLNRVADPKHYPSTVKEVIFDDVPVVQFEVTSTGGIYLNPDENSFIAACLCLGGANLAKDSTFFLNPKIGDATWFEDELRFVCTYGNFDFYAMDWGK